jgi:outer membrane protein OmpA-like peptidoglycan-associated protein
MHRRVLVALALFTLTGCPRQELYVVLPNADGRPGAGKISVNEGNTRTVLDQPFASAETRGGQPAAIPPDPTEAQTVFKQAIAARPMLPAHFRLYFFLDTALLTPESGSTYRTVLENIKQRPAYEVEIVGYTDTLGSEAYNAGLSLERAAAIRDTLAWGGVDPKAITIAGRGERDPLVVTGDQVPEPQNRRVEITVR